MATRWVSVWMPNHFKMFLYRASCPCCGHPTLSERNGFEICRICFWEDDAQDDSDADIIPGGLKK